MSNCRRSVPYRVVACLAIAAALAGLALLHPPRSGASQSLDQLHNELGAQQARQHGLAASVSQLDASIGSLESQISLVQSREEIVRQSLAADRARLAELQGQITRERAHLAALRRTLAKARTILRAQLVSQYESTPPDLVSVILNAHGFNDLLEQINFLTRAKHQQKSIITVTEAAKAAADAAVKRLTGLQRDVRQITAETAVRAQALAGMNRLLSSREAALSRARSAQRAALAASQARAGALRRQISRVEAQQAAARAAAAAAAAAAAPAPTSSGPALGPSNGWAIPYAIVLCESGGQNLPPNSAGASGYYQIIPSTWKLFGGTGPAAYLASKSGQDAVAARIWNGGAGASNWVCAGIVGIH
ncbi:MAG: coiled-coil domain-containing protein [Solirubrobacteraceae bacterium]